MARQAGSFGNANWSRWIGWTRKRRHPCRGRFWKRSASYGTQACPLIAKAKVVGVLELYRRHPLEPDWEWRGFLESLAGQAAIAIDSARLIEEPGTDQPGTL